MVEKEVAVLMGQDQLCQKRKGGGIGAGVHRWQESWLYGEGALKRGVIEGQCT